MIRKVGRQGPKTLGISLPSKWIKKYSIVKGSELHITELHDQLLIKRGKSTLQKQVSDVKIEGCDKRHIRLLINNAYRGGIDKLKVLFANPKVYDEVKHITTHFLLGFEVTKKGQD
ncbi:MAG TPA: hypothetical protein VFF28_03975, partial [Candidatus Nanoarchaeia archaeon]|nr:hypothetical protein [Candidatus Nanoarchaeia archaeon]